MMPIKVIAPTVAIAVNLPLAIWALVRAPRDPAYRVFGLLGISLMVWNLGGEVFHHGGQTELWMRLSFLGMAMAPANFLCLALVGGRRAPGNAWWHLLLYGPMLALGLLLDPALTAKNAISPGWRSGFYRLSAPDAMLFAAVTAAYLLAALGLAWRAARRAPEMNDWIFRLGLLPLVVGIVGVLAAGYLRSERTPTVSLWTMVLSQYAMFMMIRHGMVKLDLSLRRGVTLGFSALVVAACVLLGVALIGALFNRRFDQEMNLILVVSIVALCVLYAAVLPRLESLFDRYFRQPGKGEEGKEE